MKTFITTKLEKYPHTHGIISRYGAHLISVRDMAEVDETDYSGLILLGGSDIYPSLYGGEVDDSRRYDRDRDALEWYMLLDALERGVPVLSICRGMQLTNVALGGTLRNLEDDWYSNFGDPTLAKELQVSHALPRGAKHAIMTTKGLRRKVPFLVNSRHHQAVDRLGSDLSAVAYAADGTVEAIYRPGLLGVQWHPEDLYYQDRKRWGGLFKWFVKGGLQ